MTDSLRGTSAIVIILPFVCGPPEDMGLGNTMSPLSCASPLIPSYIFSCRRFFFANPLIFLVKCCSVNSCNFRLSLGGGELRFFLFLFSLYILDIDYYKSRKGIENIYLKHEGSLIEYLSW